MAQVRVVDCGDHVAVIRPNDEPSLVDGETGELETSEQRRNRSMARIYECNSDLEGRPYLDIDDGELPPRESRSKWRIKNGKVVVGP